MASGNKTTKLKWFCIFFKLRHSIMQKHVRASKMVKQIKHFLSSLIFEKRDSTPAGCGVFLWPHVCWRLCSCNDDDKLHKIL